MLPFVLPFFEYLCFTFPFGRLLQNYHTLNSRAAARKINYKLKCYTLTIFNSFTKSHLGKD